MSVNNMSLSTKNKIVNTIITAKPSEVGLSAFRVNPEVDEFFFNPSGKSVHFNLTEAGKRKMFFKHSDNHKASVPFKEILNDYLVRQFKDDIKASLLIDFDKLNVWQKCTDSYIANTPIVVDCRQFITRITIGDIDPKTEVKVFEAIGKSFKHVLTLANTFVLDRINVIWISEGRDTCLFDITNDISDILELVVNKS